MESLIIFVVFWVLMFAITYGAIIFALEVLKELCRWKPPSR